MWVAPSTPIVTNQTIMIGPKTRPIARRAFALDHEQADEDDDRGGTTNLSRLGAATVVPSTALSTEIAGVIMPSP